MHAPERCTTSAPGAEPGASAAAASAIAASGVATITSVGVAARRRRPRTARRAEALGARRARSATSIGADRPRATHRQPRATQRERDGGTGAAGTDEGERPLRVVVHVHTSSFQPLRGAGLLGHATTLDPSGRTSACSAGIRRRPRRVEVGQRHQHERPLHHPRVRDDEVGLVDLLVADQQHVDVERARPPALVPDPVGLGLEPVGELEQLAGVSVVSTATTALR